MASAVDATRETAKLVTVDEFEQMPPARGLGYELDEGEVLELTFPNPWDNLVDGALYRLMEAFVRERKLGLVFLCDTGFILSTDPPTLRGPDIAFVSAERGQDLNLLANFTALPT